MTEQHVLCSVALWNDLLRQACETAGQPGISEEVRREAVEDISLLLGTCQPTIMVDTALHS